MRDTSAYASVDDALDALLAKGVELETETVSVREAVGRVLARRVVAQNNVPQFDTSHMDGFAVKSADLSIAAVGKPVRLRVIGEIRLAETPSMTLRSGQAVVVSTGSRLPDGADAVLMAEDVSEREGLLETEKHLAQGENVYNRGKDLTEGTTAFEKGRRVRAQDIGLLMLLQARKIEVFRKPRVGVLATGDELTGRSIRSSRKVLDTHTPVIAGVLAALGCEPVNLGISPDDRRVLRAAMRKGLESCDMVVVTGGTSKGTHDVGKSTFVGLAPSTAFQALALDRGRVTGGGVVGGKPVLLLPGPIQAAMNALLVLAVPVLAKMQGGVELLEKFPVSLESDWHARVRFRSFTKVVYLSLRREGIRLSAEPQLGDTESMPLLARSDAFAKVPPAVESMKAGDEVEAALIPGSRLP